jgi:hypothetical protein
MRKRKSNTSTLTILKDECLFAPAEIRIVRDFDTKKIYSLKRYAISVKSNG